MPDLKISQLIESTEGSNLSTHYFTGYSGINNFRMSYASLAKAILGKVGSVLRTIGQNIAGSLVTTDAIQTLSNKTIAWVSATANGKTISAVNLGCLDGASENLQAGLSYLENDILDIASQVGSTNYPRIIDGTSAQVVQNKTYENPVLEITDSGALNCTIDTEIKFLNGLSANIVTLLNGKVSRYGFTEPTLPSYSLAFTASGTSKTISASDILTSFGLSAANACLSPNHFLINVMSINGSTYARAQVATTNSFSVLANGNGSDKKIDVITVSGLDSGKDYVVTILVKPIQVNAPA